MPVQTQIQMRRDTAANWTSTNPTLASGEWGLETDTRLMKIGDGTTAWTSLAYFTEVPTGGTANQVLAKIDSTNYNTQWVTPSSGSSTPVAYVPFVAGAFYRTPVLISSSGTPTTNTSYYTPFYVGATEVFDRIGCTTASVTTSGNARLGIYSDTNGAPDALVLDAGTVAFSASNTSYLITISQSLSPGWYWLVLNQQSGSSTWIAASANQTQGLGTQRMASVTSTSVVFAYSQASVTGAFPTPATPTIHSSTSTAPIAYLRAT